MRFVDKSRDGLWITVEIDGDHVTLAPSDLGVLDWFEFEGLAEIRAFVYHNPHRGETAYTFTLRLGIDEATFVEELSYALRIIDYQLEIEPVVIDAATGAMVGTVS